LVHRGTSISCPECNRFTTYETAIERRNRTRFILLCLTLALILPSILTATNWEIYFENQRTNVANIFTLAMWSQMLAIPTTAFLLIRREIAYRNNTRIGLTTPKESTVISLILTCSFFSALILAASMIIWNYDLLN